VDSRLGEIILRISKLLQGLTDRVKKLEDMAHPPRTFVRCEDCNRQIRDLNQDG